MKGEIMKVINSKYMMLILAASLIVTGSAFAQQGKTHSKGMEKQSMSDMGHGKHMPMIPGMTEQQKEQMEQLRTEHLKVMLPLKNQLQEKMVRLHTLSTAEKVNMNDINKKIEEIGELKIKMMKEQAAHRQDIRKLLTEEQRVMFDMHPMPHQDRPHMN
jgi:Spy/CpxP family protein refolding chaperone